ncbi:MAG: glycosyltransferase, partial [Acidimicrobiales bacterium]
PVPVVEEPVAAVLSDWSWPPNRYALARLLDAWPAVRDAVPGALLILGGRHFPTDAVGVLPGVELTGPVGSSLDILGRTAVVPFPCPTSSGPKVKVLEALAHGIPVVTTSSGVEGIAVGPDALPMVATEKQFVPRLVALLQNPEERARLGTAARESVAVHHSPIAAAQARLRAFAEAFDL